MPSAARELLLDALEPLREEIRATGPLEWVGLSLYLRAAETIYETLGHEATIEFWSEQISKAFDASLMRPLATGGLFLYGRNPGSMYRLLPKAYSLVFRNAGDIDVHLDGDHGAEMVFTNLPPAMRRPAVLAHFRGNCHGVLRYLGFEGEVEMDETRLAEGTLRFAVRWSARAEAEGPQPRPRRSSRMRLKAVKPHAEVANSMARLASALAS